MHFEIISASDPDLASLYQFWLKQAEIHKIDSFIHHPFWFQSFLSTKTTSTENLYFITHYENNKLLAVYPLQYCVKAKFGVPIKYWDIFWSNDMGVNDFILLNTYNSENQILTKLLHFLSSISAKFPWHYIHLQNISNSSFIAADIVKLTTHRFSGFSHHESKYILCDSTYEKSTCNISNKFKRNNRRKLRNLSKLGDIHYEMQYSEDGLKKAFAIFVEVEADNWKGSNKTALKYDKSLLNFYQNLLNLFGSKQICFIHSMWLDENPIAVQFSLLINQTYYILKIGYVASFQKFSPGNLLLDETIRHFSNDNDVNKISFITGAKWNDDWAPKSDKIYHYKIFNNNFIGGIITILESVKQRLRIIKRNYC